MEYAAATVLEQFRSNFVDASLFAQRVGGSKDDPEAIRRYLDLPPRARPEISPFFDREYYWQAHPDVRSAGVDPLVHFVRWGVVERRTPHPLIDLHFMMGLAPTVLPDPPNADALWDALCSDAADPGPFFSLEYYRSQLDLDAPIQGGLLRHFLEIGLLRGLRPHHGLDGISLYRHTEAKTFDIRSGLRALALRPSALPSTTALPPTEDEARLVSRARAKVLLASHARHPLRFNTEGKPDLSVIIVVADDDLALTLQTLVSLRANHPGNIQLILVDLGTGGGTHPLSRHVQGASIISLKRDVGVVQACNAALQWVQADAVLLMRQDIELGAGAVGAALRRLRSDPAIGAVGAKILRGDTSVREAGCIVWRDGWTIDYLRDESPLAPEANFVRDVDFSSAVFLMLEADMIKRLGGFDEALGPTRFADADLGLRIQDAGRRVVYDPAVVVHHLEQDEHPRVHDTSLQMRDAHAIFFQKHRHRLGRFHVPDRRAEVFARCATRPRGRVLFIDDQVPPRRLGSGFVRSNDVVRVIADLGYHVTIHPITRADPEMAATSADFPDTVEVMHDRAYQDLRQHLTDRRGYYDTLWIVRTHNLKLIKTVLEQGGLDFLGNTRVVLDTEAVSAEREAGRGALTGQDAPVDLDQAIEAELTDAYFCQRIVAVNRREARLIETLGFAHVAVLGHLRPLALTPRPWSRRAGMLLAGSFPTPDSPNYDSLCWFVDEVLPLIEEQLGYETRLTVAGPAGDGVVFDRFRDHARVTLRGFVPDLTPLYDAHRVFVAPTRFAAGIPHKIHEAASFGLPVVATDLLVRQLEWRDGRDLLAASASDPRAFAQHVLAVYRSEDLWTRLRDAAAERIQAECGRAAYERVIEGILKPL